VDEGGNGRGALTAAGLSCAACGAQLGATAKFCSECGTPIAQATEHAEFKQVTVLFADVVRSMDIAAALDVERFREVMTELVERSAAVLRRYGGTVEYTGDGVMAIFGAPTALEDHAFRACMAALAIQDETKQLATEVQRRDEVTLQVRVGLNSGRVIAGEIGSGSLGYGAIGEAVGFAQRMESVAPAGAVMLSESTARLVEHTATLAEPDWVRIKGADEPVRAWRLVAIGPRDGLARRVEAGLVGRGWEMAALDATVDRAIGGHGGVVNVVGPPGIGKSRMAREAAALAAARGAEVFWTFCESHARDIPFGVVAGLLRAGTGVADLDGEAARARLRAAVPADADPQDLLLLDDLLGIADPEVALPAIDPDARRRRLTALVNATTLARTEPALFIIDDVHWIDAVSESMLADFLSVIPRTRSVVLITARPEYDGALTRVHGAQAIALGPLGDSDTAGLLGELLGSDPSVGELAAVIVERAAGNPFFAEEMVRELAQRGVLTGERGGYVCRADERSAAPPAWSVVFEPSVVVLVPVVVVVVVPVVGCVFVVPLCVGAGVVDPGVNRLPGLTNGPFDGAADESVDGAVRSVVVSELLVVVVAALAFVVAVGFDRSSVVGGERSATGALVSDNCGSSLGTGVDVGVADGCPATNVG
jgi:class 3 adenylate cyclase